MHHQMCIRGHVLNGVSSASASIVLHYIGSWHYTVVCSYSILLQCSLPQQITP